MAEWVAAVCTWVEDPTAAVEWVVDMVAVDIADTSGEFLRAFTLSM